MYWWFIEGVTALAIRKRRHTNKLTRDTHLMQQFIYYYEEPVCSLVHWCKFDTKLTPVHKITHQLLRTSVTTPSAEHHMQ